MIISSASWKKMIMEHNNYSRLFSVQSALEDFVSAWFHYNQQLSKGDHNGGFYEDIYTYKSLRDRPTVRPSDL